MAKKNVTADDLDESFYEALRLLRSGKEDKAMKILEDILDIDPHYITARAFIISEYADSMHDAAQKLRQLVVNEVAYIELNGRDACLPLIARTMVVMDRLADLYQSYGDIRGALEVYRKMLDIDPNDLMNARYHLVRILFHNQMYEEVEALLRKYPFENIYKDFLRMAMAFVEGDFDDFMDCYHIFKISFPAAGRLFVIDYEESLIDYLREDHFFEEDEDMTEEKVMFNIALMRLTIEDNPQVFDNMEFDSFLYAVDEDVEEIINHIGELDEDDDFVYYGGEA